MQEDAEGDIFEVAEDSAVKAVAVAVAVAGVVVEGVAVVLMAVCNPSSVPPVGHERGSAGTGPATGTC